MEPEHIRFEVDAASIDKSRQLLCIAFQQRCEVKLDRGGLHSDHDLRVSYDNLCFHHVRQIFEVSEFELNDELVTLDHRELGLRVGSHIVKESVRFRLGNNVSVLVAGGLGVRVVQTVFVDNFTMQIKFDFLRATEIKVNARVVPRNGVQIVWGVGSVLTTLVKGGLSDVDQALLVELGRALVIAVAFGADAHILGHVLDLAAVAILFVQVQVRFVGHSPQSCLLFRLVDFAAHVKGLDDRGELPAILAVGGVRLLDEFHLLGEALLVVLLLEGSSC